jgi:serine/threonine-protein kinase RsbW
MDSHDRVDRRSEVVEELGLHPDVRTVRVRTVAALKPVFDQLEDWMRVLGYAHQDIFAVTFALFEMATNAVRHGNRNDPRKWVRVRYLVTDAEVLLEVEDEGWGFDPQSVPSPLACGGRPLCWGLFLTRAYMSWVRFNAQGNRVTLCRRRSVAQSGT